MPEIPITWAGLITALSVAITWFGVLWRIGANKQERERETRKDIDDNQRNIEYLQKNDKERAEEIKNLYKVIRAHETRCDEDRKEIMKAIANLTNRVTEVSTILKNVAPCMKDAKK